MGNLVMMVAKGTLVEALRGCFAGLKSDRSKEAGLLPLLELQGHL